MTKNISQEQQQEPKKSTSTQDLCWAGQDFNLWGVKQWETQENVFIHQRKI